MSAKEINVNCTVEYQSKRNKKLAKKVADNHIIKVCEH